MVQSSEARRGLESTASQDIGAPRLTPTFCLVLQIKLRTNEGSWSFPVPVRQKCHGGEAPSEGAEVDLGSLSIISASGKALDYAAGVICAAYRASTRNGSMA